MTSSQNRIYQDSLLSPSLKDLILPPRKTVNCTFFIYLEATMASYTPITISYLFMLIQGASKDICQKSQDKFLVTDRTNSITKSAHKDIGRANSQRILKDSSQTNLERTPKRPPPPNEKNTYVTVKKWIDYSSKYGIGYVLSNNIIGVYFNDSTKILAIS